MSERLHRGLSGSDRPMARGRRPKGRDLEITRPPALYRHGIHAWLIRLGVMERVRAEGFSRAAEG